MKKPTHLRFDEELIKQIQDAAKIQGVTPTNFIRNAVVKGLRAQDALPETTELIRHKVTTHYVPWVYNEVGYDY